MKKTKLIPLIFILSFLALSTLVFINANATTTKTTVMQPSPLEDVQVGQVFHNITVLDGGSMAINDTIELSAKAGKTATLANYSVGFPYEYKHRLADCFAFNTSNPSQMFNVTLDTGIGKLGYYGVTVTFPQGGIYLTDSQSFRFTVVFVFSNSVLSSTTTGPSGDQPGGQNVTEPVLTLDYPVYPSLPQDALLCNLTIVCPQKTSYQYGDPGVNVTKVSSRDILRRKTYSLQGFANVVGSMNFTSEENAYRVITMNELNRRIEIDGWGNVLVTDDYTITSRMQQLLTGVFVSLPQSADNVLAKDARGKAITAGLSDANTTTYSISFGLALDRGESTSFTLTYSLQFRTYLTEAGLGNFDLNFPASKSLNRVAEKMTLSIFLPEGASLKQFTSLNIMEYSLQKEALQEGIVFTAYNASVFNNLDPHITYTYSLFWASFRPTLWTMAIVAIACAAALIWKAPKPLAPTHLPGMGVKTGTIKAIVSSYEDREKIIAEIDSLERQVQKGRLPRRRYKIRRRMLEGQLARIGRDLVDFKQKAKSAGPRFADIMRELEVAEAELRGAEAETRRVEAQYRRGELSLDAYKRLQDQSNKRRERAKTIIDGALLRLSEGIA